MRRALVFAVAILLVLLPTARAQEDVRDPGRVNKIIDVIESPELAPGESGSLRLNFTNPYSDAMMNVSLNVSVYRYATIQESVPVDGSWPWDYPKLRVVRPDSSFCEARECRILRGLPLDTLPPGPPDNHMILNFTVLTSADMPHGSVFAQAAYFLRFWLEFDIDNGTRSHLRIASLGYFTPQQWALANSDIGPGCSPGNATNRCAGTLNLTHLGVDGVLPDSLFGVKEPVPLWPFYGLVVLVVFFFALAVLFWVEENPGRYPRIDRVWLRFKGRLRAVLRRPGAGRI